MKSQIRSEGNRIAVLVLLLMVAGLLGCTQTDARRRGEVTVFKGSPNSGGIVTPDALLLRGRGYSLSENIGSFVGPLDDGNLIGSKRAYDYTLLTLSSVNKSMAALSPLGTQSNDPIYPQLVNILKSLLESSNQLVNLPGFLNGKSKAQDDFLTKLARHRAYLTQLQSDVIYIKSWLLHAKNDSDAAPDFSQDLIPRDLLVEILGQPITYGEFTAERVDVYQKVITDWRTRRLKQYKQEVKDGKASKTESDIVSLNEFWTQASDNADLAQSVYGTAILPRREEEFLKSLNAKLPESAFDQARSDYSSNIFSLPSDMRLYWVDPRAVQKRFGAALNESTFLPDTYFDGEGNLTSGHSTNQAAESFASLAFDCQEAIFVVADQIQNLVEALSVSSRAGFCEWDFHSRQPKLYRWGPGLDRLGKHIQVARECIDLLFKSAGNLMGEDIEKSQGLVAKVEALAKHYASITGRSFNRQLRKSSDDSKPVRLTLFLKTLFVKNLGDPIHTMATNEIPRAGDLLAVMKLKNQGIKNTAYPVIYQQAFLPDSFVNSHDRVAYGPAIYDGSFMDVYLQILRASPPSTNVDMIRSGFQSLMSKVATVNPEFAAISPAVSALFNGILNAATREQTELEVNWTLPGEESAKSANTDSLMAETGIYIVIKTESRFRSEVQKSATKALYMNQLVYDPQTAKLYWRRSFADAKRNFTPDKEFRDKTYAVLALVDDYDNDDKLGEQLRTDLETVVGPLRANQIIPTPTSAAASFNQLLDSVGSITESNRDLKDPAKLLKWAKAQQGRLYTESSDAERAKIVALLKRYASTELQASLGDDVKKWQEAQLGTGTNGEKEVPVLRAQ